MLQQEHLIGLEVPLINKGVLKRNVLLIWKRQLSDKDKRQNKHRVMENRLIAIGSPFLKVYTT